MVIFSAQELLCPSLIPSGLERGAAIYAWSCEIQGLLVDLVVWDSTTGYN